MPRALKASKLVTLLKLAKFTKILVTATSMLVSLLAYDLFIGPWMAIGLIAMLFVHEMGHVFAMRQKGLPTALPIFIPFLGAAIFAPVFGDRYTEILHRLWRSLPRHRRARSVSVGMGHHGMGHSAADLIFGCLSGSVRNLIDPPTRWRPYPTNRPAIGSNTSGCCYCVGYTIYMGEPSLIILWVFSAARIQIALVLAPDHRRDIGLRHELVVRDGAQLSHVVH